VVVTCVPYHASYYELDHVSENVNPPPFVNNDFVAVNSAPFAVHPTLAVERMDHALPTRAMRATRLSFVCRAHYSTIWSFHDMHAHTPAFTFTTNARNVRYDHQLHFYNLAASQSQPRMLIVDDVEDAFIPMPQDLLVNLEECKDNVKQLLEQLPVLFKDATSDQSCLGEALKAGRKLVQHLGARVSVFQTIKPNIGEGKIERAADQKLNGDDLAGQQPANAFYKQFSVESSRCQIGIDLFFYGRGHGDLATLGQVVKFAGGALRCVAAAFGGGGGGGRVISALVLFPL
jgi:hypothetical protein